MISDDDDDDDSEDDNNNDNNNKNNNTVKSRIQYAHLYNMHPKLSQENRGKTLV